MQKISQSADVSDSTTQVNFPDGIGIFMALECFNSRNTEECMKLLENAYNAKRKACGRVKYLYLLLAVEVLHFYLESLKPKQNDRTRYNFCSEGSVGSTFFTKPIQWVFSSKKLLGIHL
jgi:hypothetical protein